MNVRTWRRFHIKRTKTWITTYVSACNFACDPTLRKRLQSLSCSYGRITSIPVKINFIAAPRCQFFHIVGTLYRIAILREPRGWNTTNSAAAELHRSPCSCSLFEMSSRPSFSILAFSNRAKSAMHYTRVKRRSGLRIRNQVDTKLPTTSTCTWCARVLCMICALWILYGSLGFGQIHLTRSLSSSVVNDQSVSLRK